MPRWLRLASSLSVVIALVLAGAWWWAFERPLPLPTAPYPFEVRSGANLRQVARDLAAQGIVPAEVALVGLARWRGVDRAIKAGNYEFAPGITLPRLLAELTQGDPRQVALTVVEGSTFADLRRTLRGDANIVRTVLDLPDAELMQKLGIEAGGSPEGWFYPDTYFFAHGSQDVAILKRAYRLMRARLDGAWASRVPDLPLQTPYDALILASIVEKETGRAMDRPLIASVFINRLRQGMRLQTDPTVIYGMGERFDGDLRRRDLETDTPFNTYTRGGLPPTPIALPGQASLEAVTRPPQTPYLYFVARGDGTSEFSTTLADHNRAVAKYQRNAR